MSVVFRAREKLMLLPTLAFHYLTFANHDYMPPSGSIVKAVREDAITAAVVFADEVGMIPPSVHAGGIALTLGQIPVAGRLPVIVPSEAAAGLASGAGYQQDAAQQDERE